jgi:hypothetical protein
MTIEYIFRLPSGCIGSSRLSGEGALDSMLAAAARDLGRGIEPVEIVGPGIHMATGDIVAEIERRGLPTVTRPRLARKRGMRVAS